MKVLLNVYDIIGYNKYVDCIGMGAYHTGTATATLLMNIL
jgi:hypothetical protein